MRQTFGLAAIVSGYVLCLAGFLVAALSRPAFDVLLPALTILSFATSSLALFVVGRVAVSMQPDFLRSTLVVAAITLLLWSPIACVMAIATGSQLATPLILFGVGVVIVVWRAFFD